MCKELISTLGCILIVSLLGCGKSSQNNQSPQSSLASNSAASANAAKSGTEKLVGPAATVYEFLEAVRTGDDERASQKLSHLARSKTATLNRNVTPPASDTARFRIGEVKYVGADGAQVQSFWTDLDIDGEASTDEAVWVLRHEKTGWGIAGVAVEIFPNEPPLLLNFEDPEDMFRKQQWVREEIRRRMNGEGSDLQAQGESAPSAPVKR